MLMFCGHFMLVVSVRLMFSCAILLSMLIANRLYFSTELNCFMPLNYTKTLLLQGRKKNEQYIKQRS